MTSGCGKEILRFGLINLGRLYRKESNDSTYDLRRAGLRTERTFSVETFDSDKVGKDEARGELVNLESNSTEWKALLKSQKRNLPKKT